MYSALTEKYQAASNKLVLLDYDGTLLDYTSHPDQANPSAYLLQLLQCLSDKPHTKLAIVTGRTTNSIDNLFQQQPFDMVAEHGAMIKQNSHWTCLLQSNTDWKQSVSKMMQNITDKCSNSFIEEKQFTMAWHYRNCDEKKGNIFSRELITDLKILTAQFEFKITDGNKVVEVSSKQISKSIAVSHFLSATSYGFILCIGDDKTDEDMFRTLSDNNHAYTIKVGEGATFAKYRLKSVSEVLQLLEELSK